MDPTGSTTWIERVEPELEAAMLNRYAGRPGSGGGLIRAAAPCPAGTNASIRRSPSSSWARARRRAAACAAAAVMKPVRCVPSTNTDQVLVAASRHTIRLPNRPRSAAKCRSDVRHQQTGWCIAVSPAELRPLTTEGYQGVMGRQGRDAGKIRAISIAGWIATGQASGSRQQEGRQQPVPRLLRKGWFGPALVGRHEGAHLRQVQLALGTPSRLTGRHAGLSAVISSAATSWPLQ